MIGAIALSFAASAAALARTRREDAEEDSTLVAALEDLLRDSLDDLRAERDPRRAVIRTYARMETTFAAYGMPRDKAEARLEFLARVLGSLRVSSFSLRRLTHLFERAKFSTHEIDLGMKHDAVDALADLRAELEGARQVA